MRAPRISFLCPSLVQRRFDRNRFPAIEDVRRQIVALGSDPAAELVILEDEGRRSVGEKCNALLSIARGDFVAFFSDDDFVNDCYVEKLLEAIEYGSPPDAVTFDVDWQAGEPFLDWPVSSCELRPIALVRRELAQRFIYPDWFQSEDRAFRVWLWSKNPRVFHVNSVLYGYNYRPEKPEFAGREFSERSSGTKSREEIEEWVRYVDASGRIPGCFRVAADATVADLRRAGLDVVRSERKLPSGTG